MNIKKHIKNEKLSFVKVVKITDEQQIKTLEEIRKSDKPLPDDVIIQYGTYTDVFYYKPTFPEDIDSNMTNYLLAENIKELRKQTGFIKTIKSCVVFFTALTIISLVVGVLAGLIISSI